MSTLNQNTKRSANNRHLVIIAGYYGFDNLGDEAILEELLNELSFLYDRQSIVVLSHNPPKTSSVFGIESANRWNWFDCLKLFSQAKLLISGGGGLFQDRTGFGSVLFYSFQIFLARLCGAKVLIYAQGLGPLQTLLGKGVTKLAFAQANKITVRDKNSLSLVKEWGLEAYQTADPVWSLTETNPPDSACQQIEKIKQNTKGPIIGLSLREDGHLQNYHLEYLAKGLIEALPNESAILFLPFQIDQDQLALKTVEQLLLQSNLNTYWLDPNMLVLPSQWLGLMKNLDLVLGMRFHALLMALKMSKPVIGIAYDQKVNTLLSEFKQPILSLNANEYECQTIWQETITNTISKQDFLEARINAPTFDTSEVLEKAKQLSSENIRSLAKILEVDTTGNVTTFSK